MLVIAMVLTLALPVIKNTMANSANTAAETTILYFEQTNPVFEDWVEAGTRWEDLDLPTELRAIIIIDEDMAQSEQIAGDGITGDEPTLGEDMADEAGKDTYYIEATTTSLEEGATEIRPGETVLNEAPSAEEGEGETYIEATTTSLEEESAESGSSETAINEAPGAEEGEGGQYAIDENGNIIGAVMSIPVTWEGEYDGNEPGIYIITAHIENFLYSGEMPTARITVKAEAGLGSISGVLMAEIDDGSSEEETQDVYNAQVAEDTQNAHNAQNAGYTEGATDKEGAASIEGAEGIEGAEVTEEAADMEASEDAEDAERDDPHSGNEYPLAGYIVYLYTADDLTKPLDMTKTDSDGA